MCEVEPVFPVLGHRCRDDGALQRSAGVVAETLHHLGTEFVVVVEIVEKALVDGVEVDDEELAHGSHLGRRQEPTSARNQPVWLIPTVNELPLLSVTISGYVSADSVGKVNVMPLKVPVPEIVDEDNVTDDPA